MVTLLQILIFIWKSDPDNFGHEESVCGSDCSAEHPGSRLRREAKPEILLVRDVSPSKFIRSSAEKNSGKILRTEDSESMN